MDDEIDELGFSRFVQIIASIRTRRYLRKREEDLRTSWAVRGVNSHIIGSYQMKKEDKEPIFMAAASASLDDIEKEYLKGISGQTALDEWTPGSPAPIPESKIPQTHQLMQMLGGKSGHAGAGHGG